MIILQAEAVSKHVQLGGMRLDILREITLSVNQSETIAILGASGSGKTTLLGLLAGLDIPSSGKINMLNHDISAYSEEARAALRLGNVGFVFQNFELLPHLTALENVMLPMTLANKPKAKQRSENILEKLGLGARMGHYPAQLSGGEQQRVAIARAYVIEPQLLFADEPTGSLDEATGQLILNVLFELNQIYHTTLVFVTHDVVLAKRCQTLYHLSQGVLTS